MVTRANACAVMAQVKEMKSSPMDSLDVLLRDVGFITNSNYREAFGVEAGLAGFALAALVKDGVLVREGEKRGTKYRRGEAWGRSAEQMSAPPVSESSDDVSSPIDEAQPVPMDVVGSRQQAPIAVTSADGRRKVTHADLNRVNLGRSFWGSRTDMIQSEKVRDLVLRYRKNILQMSSTGSGLVFSGPPGVGKTSAAACVLKEAISAGLSGYFTTHSEL